MLEYIHYFWLVLGAILIFAEVILPGLVSVFIGLGAMTVYGLLHYNYISTLPEQLIAWFVSSMVYIFTLRLLVMNFYPSSMTKENINEDDAMIGKSVEVVETINEKQEGRVYYSDTTWQARSIDGLPIAKGSKVEIIRRENISLIVKEVK